MGSNTLYLSQIPVSRLPRGEEDLTRRQKWDLRFLKQARDWSVYSKDPSTQTGAVVVRPDLSLVATGYNGFAPGVDDAPERYANRALKYKLILHCEVNAMDTAREPLHGYSLYTWPFMSCSRCTTQVIKRGITRHVAPEIPAEKRERWEEDMDLSAMMFGEAGVAVTLYSSEDIEYWLTKLMAEDWEKWLKRA